MLCSDLMKRYVERCLDTSLVSEAAEAMRDKGIGFLPVTDEDAVVLGAITDRDIVLRVLAADRAPDRTLVSETMTREVVWCRPEDDLDVAEDLMKRFQRSRIVCADDARHIAGVISLSDIAKLAVRGHAGMIAASIALREAASEPSQHHAGIRGTLCRQIMKSPVDSCVPSTPARHVARMMREGDFGFLPVCNARGAAIGAVTDRDLVVRMVAERRDADRARVGEIYTRTIVTCSPDEPLSVAEDLMSAHKTSRILCVDEARRPAGVISLSDLARVERFRRVARILREITSRAA